ncbi:Phosphatidylinositol 4-kinase LSB6 [Rhodotorula kratochvilovae]
MGHDEFEGLVQQVRLAIDAGVHPRLNAKGSSGSYFARNVSGRTLGIFKPADEEPYGTLNPKFVKWVHREFLARVIPFGRACLPPGQSYLSEAAACVVDAALGTNVVPRTEVVTLASPAFYYDWVDLERAARGHPLREKEGSFQVFLEGFVDASAFLAQHPFPGRPVAPASHSKKHKRDAHPHRRGRRRGCVTSSLLCLCGRTGAECDDAAEEERARETRQKPQERRMHVDGEEGVFEWTAETVDSFREELEKLVVLDFLIRNTDRGLDNFMLKPCSLPCSSSPASPPNPHLHLAAIDNSLAFPHQHPSGWRTYTYGWLFLPLSLIGQPWSARARAHFLPRLADPGWWADLRVRLRAEFERDRAFSEETWERQWSVVKGQGYLLVQSLRSADEGPVELCRRPKKLVRDEYRLVPVPSALHSATALADASSAPAPAPNLRRFGSEPLSLDAAVSGLHDASDDDTSRFARPPLPERRSAPAHALPQAPGPAPCATAGSTEDAPLVVRRHQHHRRARSDFASGGGPSAASAASHGFFAAASSAPDARGPLDALARAPSRAAEAEEGEETGVALLARLDRFEAAEKRRRRRARRDVRAREVLEGAVSDGEVEGGGGRGWFRRGGRRSSSGSVRAGRGVGEEVGERRRLLDGAITEADEEDEEGEAEGGADGRMVMSWYGGQGGTVARELDEDVQVGDAGGGRRRMQWVVVERLEDVKEVPRRWPWRW